MDFYDNGQAVMNRTDHFQWYEEEYFKWSIHVLLNSMEYKLRDHKKYLAKMIGDSTYFVSKRQRRLHRAVKPVLPNGNHRNRLKK